MNSAAGENPRAGAAPLLSSTGLLIRLRLRRLANQIDALSERRKKDGTNRRTGHAGKKSSRVVFYVAWPLMTLVFGTMIAGALANLHVALDPPDTFWRTVEFSQALTLGAAFLLLMMWLSSLLISVASGELAKPEWDLEWLITLPVRSDTLIWARILERSVVQPTGVLQIGVACTVLAWLSGYRWTAPLLGILTAWPLMLLGATARTLIDTGLRLAMRPAQLRNLHAALSVLSIIALYLALSLGMPNKSAFMAGIAASMPDWLLWTPVGLTVRVLNDRDIAGQLLCLLALLAEVGVLTWLGAGLLRFQLRNGVLSGGARDAARARAIEMRAAPGTQRLAWLGPVQRRELALLSRDRNFMVQCLVLPLLIVGAQILLGTSSVASDMWTNPNVLASVAFGLAAYSISMSAFQTLNTEGHALWLLYTFPRSLEDVLKDKARLWGVLTLAYPLILFGVGAVLAPVIDWKFLGGMFTALIGIPIYAFIAVALGVFGSNPLEQQQSQKVKPGYFYLYMMLSALYVYAVVTPDLTQRLVFMTLTVLLAFALWQKARDRLPYLLDPDASPPPRVSLSDGLIAAMVFFVLQALLTLLALRIFRGGGITGAALMVAFCAAGALTYLLMRWVYARAKTRDVPRILATGPGRPLTGIALGLAAGAIALLYLYVANGAGWLENVARDKRSLEQLGWWILPLALVAAPIFEEFIFRGLIFGGLRRSFPLWPATLASAAVFAVMHTSISMVPVFALGVATALAYERTRGLLAPMLAHAAYNACAIGAQLLLL
jgi:membrane protease YdiL (CAAX protease family)